MSVRLPQVLECVRIRGVRPVLSIDELYRVCSVALDLLRSCVDGVKDVRCGIKTPCERPIHI